MFNIIEDAITKDNIVDNVISAFDCLGVEREILLTKLIIKAKDFGSEKEISNLIKHLTKLDKENNIAYKEEIATKEREIPSLASNGKGGLALTIDNMATILENDSYYSKVYYNLLLNAPVVEEKDYLRRWNDTDASLSKRHLEKEYGLYSSEKHRDALRILFHQREYHPVRELIEGFEWDGINRVEEFLIKWAKAEDTPYTREVSRLIFAGGIWRVYRPGCKFDDVPILIGTKQGEGKSSLVRWLAVHDDFYGEAKTVEGKESIEQLEGAWIVEFSELLALTKQKQQEAVKSYITTQKDKMRKAYAENVQEFPRQCVFIGTTNNDACLVDKTGNRRFYPVVCHSNAYELYNHEQECREYIVQCWAEAKARFDAGEFPNYARPDLKADYERAQDEAMQDDWRIGVIGEYLDQKADGEFVCAKEIADKALSSNPENPRPLQPKESREISQIIAKFYPEWEKIGFKRLSLYGSQRCWQKSSAAETKQLNELPF